MDSAEAGAAVDVTVVEEGVLGSGEPSIPNPQSPILNTQTI